jgi:hypothetical protein
MSISAERHCAAGIEKELCGGGYARSQCSLEWGEEMAAGFGSTVDR